MKKEERRRKNRGERHRTGKWSHPKQRLFFLAARKKRYRAIPPLPLNRMYTADRHAWHIGDVASDDVVPATTKAIEGADLAR